MHKQVSGELEASIMLDPTALPRMVASLREGQGLQVSGDLGIRYFREDDLRAIGQDYRLFHVVNHLHREGAEAFQRLLEEEFFPPGTASNSDHQVRYFQWRSLLWEITSVPFERRSCCVQAARRTAMRLADGIPQILRRDDSQFLTTLRHRVPEFVAERFPLDSERVFTLENLFTTSKFPRLVRMYFGASDD